MRHRTTPSILLGVTLLASVASAVQAGVTLTFQQGVNGYYETQDTTLSLDEPGTIHGGRSVAAVGDPPLYDQALLKFDGIFGLGSNQIVPGSLVESATLTLQAWHSDLSNLQQQINVHQMLTPWSESSATFNSMGNGISANNIEAKATPVAEIRDRNTTVRPVTVDVTDTLRNWSGGKTNYGWALLGGEHGSGGWMFRSSEESNIAYRPELSVTYSEPVPQYIFSQQDLVLQSGRDQAEGGFGTSTQAMDPLFGIDRPFNPYLPEIYGNNIETQNGWESTRTWGPHAVQDGVATAYKSFDEGTRLNGQYSRVGAKPGNLALFGIGFVNDDYPRRRDLSTHSAGAVQIQNGGPDPLAINS